MQASTRRWLLLYLLTALVAAAAVLLLEAGVRRAEAARAQAIAADLPGMLRQLAGSRIEGREIGNQMLVQNVNLLARVARPETVTTAYIGTSRSKVLRPSWAGQQGAVNASGNSYNEISYGELLQAEALRRQFPNLKHVYFEASMLLRRPNRLVLEEDHRKYLPLLEAVLPLRDQLPGGAEFRAQVAKARDAQQAARGRLHLLAWRGDMRLSRLFGAKDKSMPVTDDGLFRELAANGERAAAPPGAVPADKQRPEIAADHVKVRRLRPVERWAPWDGLFDLIALWGRQNGIEVILFQPPVRSDLFRYKQAMGYAAHVADLERVAQRYGVPLIDLNRPELGYMEDWTLFSDEDHMETCAGVALLHAALDAGTRAFREKRDLLPRIPRAQAQALAAPLLRQCGEVAR